jgi:hypothetical protein
MEALTKLRAEGAEMVSPLDEEAEAIHVIDDEGHDD